MTKKKKEATIEIDGITILKKPYNTIMRDKKINITSIIRGNVELCIKYDTTGTGKGEMVLYNITEVEK